MAEVKLPHHHQYLTPAKIHDSCFRLLALSISLPTSANGPVTAPQSHGRDLPPIRTVQLCGTLEGQAQIYLDLSQPHSGKLSRPARAMLECPPCLLNREFNFPPPGTISSITRWKTSFQWDDYAQLSELCLCYIQSNHGYVVNNVFKFVPAMDHDSCVLVYVSHVVCLCLIWTIGARKIWPFETWMQIIELCCCNIPYRYLHLLSY